MKKSKSKKIELRRNKYIEDLLKKSQKTEPRNKMNTIQLNWRFDNTESIIGITFKSFFNTKYAFIIRREDNTFALLALGKNKNSSVKVFNIIDIETFSNMYPIRVLDFWDDSRKLYDSLEVIKSVSPNGYIDIMENKVLVYELV